MCILFFNHGQNRDIYTQFWRKNKIKNTNRSTSLLQSLHLSGFAWQIEVFYFSEQNDINIILLVSLFLLHHFFNNLQTTNSWHLTLILTSSRGVDSLHKSVIAGGGVVSKM